jgi:protein gp37
MAGQTAIEWAEMTWNPTTGCTKISPGCKNCYAATFSKRLQAMGVAGYENGFAISLMNDRLEQPKKRSKPTIWFVNSMSDLVHEKVPFPYIDKIFDTIVDSPQHIFQILTKRPSRMVRYFRSRPVPPNAWLGVTVEDSKFGTPRIELLNKIEAQVKFLSVEPLLEDIGKINLSKVQWVIVGGESGSQARPMNIDWARNIRDQCIAADVAFFFKQWGAHGPDGSRRAKSANGRELDGCYHAAMPPIPGIVKNGQ